MLHRAEKSQTENSKTRLSIIKNINKFVIFRYDPSSKTNYCFLSSPEKIDRLKGLHTQIKVLQQRVRRLTIKLAENTELNGIAVDSDLHSDLSSIINEAAPSVVAKHPPESILSIFFGSSNL